MIVCFKDHDYVLERGGWEVSSFCSILFFIVLFCSFLFYFVLFSLVEAVFLFVGAKFLHWDGNSEHVVGLPLTELVCSYFVIGIATDGTPLGRCVVVGGGLDLFYVVEVACGFPLS